jgi:hypothetical protein
MTGSGTENDPYMIYDVDDLQAINDLLGGTRYSRPWDDSSGEAEQHGTWTTYPIEGYSPELFWNKVDEEVSDDDATYIQAESDGAYVLLAPEGTPLSLPIDAANIQVHIHARVRNTASGTSALQGMVRYAGTDYLVGSSTSYTSQSYSLRTWTIDQPPWLGGLEDWRPPDVYALTSGFGVMVSDATPNIRITQLYIEVSYTVPVYYRLANDINAAATATWNEDPENPGTYFGFHPVGYYVEDDDYIWTGRYFSGGLDGDGHTITGLYINRTDGDGSVDSFVGLFGITDTVVIKDVTLADVDITGSQYSRAGALVGSLRQAHVENCHSSGIVEGRLAGGLSGSAGNVDMHDCSSSCAVSGYTYAGGLVGDISNPSTIYMKGCGASGDVVGQSTAAITCGGLLGRVCYGAEVVIEQSYATGSVTASSSSTASSGRATAGGLIGLVNGDGTIVSNCYARGAASADQAGGHSFAGGLIGRTIERSSVYSNCFSTGLITGDTTGGLIATRVYYSSPDTLAPVNCFWDTETSGQAASEGGTGLTTAEMKDITPFFNAGWDIGVTDEVYYNNGYPFLSWQIGNSPTWLISSPYAMFSDVYQVVHFQPNAIILGTTLPNRAGGGGIYPDGTFSWGANPAGIETRLDSFLMPESVYRFEPIMPAGWDIIEPEPGTMTGGVDLARLANNPFHPLAQVIASAPGLTLGLAWLGMAILVLIAVMLTVQLKGQHMVFTSLAGVAVATMFYSIGVWGLWVVILLVFGLIASVVYERMPTL